MTTEWDKLEEYNLILEKENNFLKQKLTRIRGIVGEYPICSKDGMSFDWDELINRIREVLNDG